MEKQEKKMKLLVASVKENYDFYIGMVGLLVVQFFAYFSARFGSD